MTIRELLRATLRHRPDRIIVGEVRGGEAFDLLQALNTGHAGSLSTIHANSAEQALARFASCVVQSGVELPYQAVRYQIADAIDLVLHLGRQRGARVVEELIQVERYDAQRDGYDTVVLFNDADDAPPWPRRRSRPSRVRADGAGPSTRRLSGSPRLSQDASRSLRPAWRADGLDRASVEPRMAIVDGPADDTTRASRAARPAARGMEGTDDRSCRSARASW